MSTDFYDDDLVKHSGASRKTRGGLPQAEPGSTEAPARAVSELNLTRMARQKEQVEDHMAHAAQELERLRQRQENLEKEKNTLEEMRRRQAEYEKGKREMLDKLNRSLLSLEKDEINAEKLLELVTGTRKQCRTWLADIDSLDEDAWPEDQFREELTRALARIEDIRMEYNKALAKIQAAGGEDKPALAPRPAVLFDESEAGSAIEKGFSYWVKVGFAVSLPVIITLVALWLLFYMQSIGLL
jgi:DNA repair exonuclease SbcCD ATPase subunit